jgi:hypothetical protein
MGIDRLNTGRVAVVTGASSAIGRRPLARWPRTVTVSRFSRAASTASRPSPTILEARRLRFGPT